MLTPSLRSVTTNSLLLCTRTSIMVYPLLVVLLLLSLTASTLQASAGWWATSEGWGLIVSIALVMVAIFAGWLGMALHACNTWALLHAVWPNEALPRLNQIHQASPVVGDTFVASVHAASQLSVLPAPAMGPITSMHPFSLFKAFVPAVGEYFGPLLGGLLAYAVLFMALLWGVEALGMAWFGEPSATLTSWLKVLNEAPLTNQVAQQFMAGFEALPSADRLWLARWNLLILGASGAYALALIMTLLMWPLRLLWQKPLWWCAWQSIKQPFHDPWGFFVATTILTLLDSLLLVAAFISGVLPWISALLQVLWLGSWVYRTYWLLFYVIVRMGSPHLFWLEADEKTPRTQKGTLVG